MTDLLFVSGTMRSGTTLLSDLLYSQHLDVARHPDLAVSMEKLPAYRRIVRALWRLPGNARRFYDPAALPGIPDAGGQLADLGLVEDGADYAVRLRALLQREIVRSCPRVRAPSVTGLKYTNIFSEFLLLARHLPEAKLLLLVRDPRDVFASHRRRTAGRHRGDQWRILADLLMLHEFIGRHGDSGSIQVIRYEDLVEQLPDTILACLDFAGVDPARYDFRSLERPGMVRNSSFGPGPAGSLQTSEASALSRSAPGRSGTEATPAELAFVERVCAKGMEAFGYAPAYSLGPALPLPEPKAFFMALMQGLHCAPSLLAAVRRAL